LGQVVDRPKHAAALRGEAGVAAGREGNQLPQLDRGRLFILPLTFADPSDYDRLKQGDTIRIVGVAKALKTSLEINAAVKGSDRTIRLRHMLSERQIDILLAGGAINWRRDKASPAANPLSGAKT
jgi:hypothetical protein